MMIDHGNLWKLTSLGPKQKDSNQLSQYNSLHALRFHFPACAEITCGQAHVGHQVYA